MVEVNLDIWVITMVVLVVIFLLAVIDVTRTKWRECKARKYARRMDSTGKADYQMGLEINRLSTAPMRSSRRSWRTLGR